MKTIELKAKSDLELELSKVISDFFYYITDSFYKYITVDRDGSVWVWSRKPTCNGSGYWGGEDNISMFLKEISLTINPQDRIYELREEK
jgi:hypothetical protein